MIPSDKIQDFFFMGDEEEMKEYGFSSKQASIALSGNILKEKTKDEVGTSKKSKSRIFHYDCS